MRRFAAAIVLSAAAASPLAAQDWDRERPFERWSRREGVHIRIGRDYYLPADRTITRPVVIVGASATLDGRVDDDVLVVGGTVRIGPTARVRGEVATIGGAVHVSDGAEVTGEVRDISFVWPEIRFLLRDIFSPWNPAWSAALALAATILRFVLTLIAACLLALVAPGWIRRIEGQAGGAPFAAGFVGLAGEALALPVLVFVVVGLVVTIVGIPLLLLVPFAVLAFVVVWLAGFAGVAAQLGGRLRSTPYRSASRSVVGDVAAGVALLFVLTGIGNVLAFVLWPASNAFALAGFVVEYLAWTVGLGAALLAPLRRPWTATPPPLPISTPVPPPSHGFGPANA